MLPDAAGCCPRPIGRKVGTSKDLRLSRAGRRGGRLEVMN
jgi:hypothetical protein